MTEKEREREREREREKTFCFSYSKGRANTTGENGEWGKTKQRSENQVDFSILIVFCVPPNNITTVSFNFVCS
jgi:hypothetical protein